MTEDMTMVAEAMLAAYAESINAADADGLAELWWLDDQRCSAIEDSIAEPISGSVYADVLKRVHRRDQPGDHLRWRDIRCHRLGPDVGYVTALQRYDERWRRVTLILLKKGAEWGILHSHISAMPTE